MPHADDVRVGITHKPGFEHGVDILNIQRYAEPAVVGIRPWLTRGEDHELIAGTLTDQQSTDRIVMSRRSTTAARTPYYFKRLRRENNRRCCHHFIPGASSSSHAHEQDR